MRLAAILADTKASTACRHAQLDHSREDGPSSKSSSPLPIGLEPKTAPLVYMIADPSFAHHFASPSCAQLPSFSVRLLEVKEVR